MLKYIPDFIKKDCAMSDKYKVDYEWYYNRNDESYFVEIIYINKQPLEDYLIYYQKHLF